MRAIKVGILCAEMLWQCLDWPAPALADSAGHGRTDLVEKVAACRRETLTAVGAARKPAEAGLRKKALSGRRTARTLPFTALHYEQGLPRAVFKEDLQRLLQQMVTSTYGIGFRRLGEPVDFFHGHIIFGTEPSVLPAPARSPALMELGVVDDPSLSWSNRPVAILYHTQEFAFDAVKVGDRVNGYVNRQKRNWLQLWDTGAVFDAQDFALPGEQVNEHFSLFESQLDPARLHAATLPGRSGNKRIRDSFQFQFERVERGAPAEPRQEISVVLPDGKPVRLRISSNVTRDIPNPYESTSRR